jgi:hypothetical protein
MTKINPYDLPQEEKNSTHVILRNIKWDVQNLTSRPEGKLPVNMRIPIDGSTPRSLIVPKALDVASSVWGFSIVDCDVDPVELPSVETPDDSLSDTLDFEGEIY